MGSWAQDITDQLAQLKDAGYTFEESWRAALHDHPLRGRDAGELAPSLFDVNAGDREATLSEFTRAACDDAWHGRRPRLTHFQVALIRDTDDSTPARRGLGGRRSRQAS